MSAKGSVLIVEDEIILQDVYKMVLTSKGYDVHVANNGVEGLTKLKQVKPCVALVDIFMPVMDGRELFRNLEKESYPDTRFVVYSNLSDSKTEEEMRRLGADEFILKASMTPNDLIDMIDRLCQANSKK